MKAVVCACVCLLYLGGVAQPQASLTFSTDTLAVGRLVEARLEIRHSAGQVVVFPRQAADFAPFELAGRTVLPTQTRDGRSTDAVIYHLRTFSLAPRQALRLRYGYLRDQDTLWAVAASDSLRLLRRVGLVPTPPDWRHSKPLQDWRVPRDYSRLLVLVATLIVFLALLALVLHKPLLAYLQRRRLYQEYRSLMCYLASLRQHRSQPEQLDGANRLWKQYIDPEATWHLASLTTTELERQIQRFTFLTRPQQQTLLRLSGAVDEVLYAGHTLSETALQDLLWNLEGIIDATYQARRQALRRGTTAIVPDTAAASAQ
ncbi:MAG: hypothetical protein OHK0039_34240 [Bacteroidia bacterium]